MRRRLNRRPAVGGGTGAGLLGPLRLGPQDGIMRLVPAGRRRRRPGRAPAALLQLSSTAKFGGLAGGLGLGAASPGFPPLSQRGY